MPDTPTEPRCPYCDERASGKWGVLYGDGTPEDDMPIYEIHCMNRNCCADRLIRQICKADCIRKASTLLLVDRLVRQACREALAKVAYLCDEYQESDPANAISHVLKDYQEAEARNPEKGKP